MNWYYNNLNRRMCTTWGTLASDPKIFILLQLDSTVKYAPHKYFLNFPIAHFTASDSPKKYVLTFPVVTPLISR